MSKLVMSAVVLVWFLGGPFAIRAIHWEVKVSHISELNLKCEDVPVLYRSEIERRNKCR